MADESDRATRANSGFRILHTEWSLGWGGQEMRIVAESVAMRKRGHTVLLACQPESQILAKARAEGLQTIPMRIRKGVDIFAARQCARAIRAHGIQLVHTHSSPDAWACGIAGRIAGIPVVRSRHLSTTVRPGWSSRFLYSRLADRVITSGQAIKDALVRNNGIDANRIVSVPAGIDVVRFAPTADGAVVRRELGIAETDFVVGIVAVLRSWKGHSFLIDAVHGLMRDNVPVKLLVVGTGPQEEVLRQKVADLGLERHVLMVGHRTDVPRMISAMNVSVLPSIKNEATSQVLPQAMAMKIPVIASRAGGLPEVVRHQETGLLVPPSDAEALREALLWIYRHPAESKQMAERGYVHVHANFTFDIMIDRTEAVYRELLGGR